MRVTEQQQKTWTKQEGEITSLAHFVLYPAILAPKILRGFCFIIGMGILCLVWQAYEHLGWIVGIGPNSLEYRQQYVDRVSTFPADFDLDFGAHPVMSRERKEYLKPHMGYDKRFDQIDPHTSYIETIVATEVNDPDQRGSFPQLCRGQSDPDFTSTRSTERGQWKYRSVEALLNKTVEMDMAIVRGQIMKSQLRHAIAMMKFGSPETFPQLDGWGFCSSSVKLSKWSPIYPETLDESPIHLNHAPTIRVRHTYITSGMCVVGHCQDSDLVWKFGRYSDLFETEPSLTAGQREAIAALDQMETLAFWLQAAHENGVTKRDDRVKLHFESAQQVLQAIVNKLPSRTAREVCDNRGKRPIYGDSIFAETWKVESGI